MRKSDRFKRKRKTKPTTTVLEKIKSQVSSLLLSKVRTTVVSAVLVGLAKLTTFIGEKAPAFSDTLSQIDPGAVANFFAEVAYLALTILITRYVSGSDDLAKKQFAQGLEPDGYAGPKTLASPIVAG
jgi:hypothetical protein